MQKLSNRLEKVPFMLSGEPKFLSHFVRRLPSNPSILEIGTFKGLSAVVMAKARPDVEITTIDSHIGIPNSPQLYSNPYIIEANLKKYGVSNRVRSITSSSQDFSPKNDYDLLFIDGDHSFEGVSFDYTKFEPFVKKGGFIVFHDYTFSDIARFVDTLNFKYPRRFQFSSMVVFRK